MFLLDISTIHTLSQLGIGLQFLLFFVIIIVSIESSGAGRVAKLLKENILLNIIFDTTDIDRCWDRGLKSVGLILCNGIK